MLISSNVCFIIPVSPGWRREQEAARQDPDNAEYRILIKQYKLMESTKEAGNKAFKSNDLRVRVNGNLKVSLCIPFVCVSLSSLF